MRRDSVRIALLGSGLIVLGVAWALLDYYVLDMLTLLFDVLFIAGILVAGIAILALAFWEPPVEKPKLRARFRIQDLKVKCKYCGTLNKATDRTCHSCGATL
jgi:hypothetical protein